MQKLGLFVASVAFMAASLSAHAGKVLLEVSDAKMVLVSYTYLGMPIELHNIRPIGVDRRLGMIGFVAGNQEIETACRGQYEAQYFGMSNKLVSVVCTTKDGHHRIRYKIVD